MKHRKVIARWSIGSILVACFLFAFASSAFALSAYTEAAPAPGSVTPDTTPLISVKVSDPAGIWMSGAQIKVDGLLRTPKLKWGPGNSYVILSYQQTKALTNGPHTLYASVFTGAGRTSYSWTFTVGSEPTIGALSPADGSVVDTRIPAISALVNTNGGTVASYEMTVDGHDVAATYDPANGTLSHTPSVPLANGIQHTVTVRVTTTGGASADASWGFGVQIYAGMPETDACAQCHMGFPAAHPVDDCSACHGGAIPYYDTGYDNVADSHAPGTRCSSCHGDLTDCGFCHSGAYPAVPVHAALDVAHLTSTDMDGCECHERDLTIEHGRYSDQAGDPYTCMTCHGSTDPDVRLAIATGARACPDCHSFSGASHEALHTLERTDGCVDCHEGASLTSVHADAELGCDTCHESTEARVVSAIAQGLLACDSCHTAQGVDYHLNMAVHYAPDSYETCGSCHHAWGSSPVRGPDVTRHRGGCITCHNDTMDLTGLSTKCTNCHVENGTDFHPTLATDHTPQDDASLGCARCHETTDVRDVHTTWSCETCHSGGCSDCHSIHNSEGGALEKTTSCYRCHTAQGTDYHADFTADHTFAGMDAGCQGTGCHVSSLVDAHVSFVGEGGRYPSYTDTCACHLNEDPERVPADATADCSSCHEPHGDLGEAHTASLSGAAFSILGTSFGSHACSECHESTDLRDLHDDCSTCHPTPADTAMPYAGGCVQGGCHSAGSSAPQHASIDVAHAVVPQSCVATGCHVGGTNVAAIHQAEGCAACHAPGVTPSTDCATCHDLGSPHGDDRAIHQPSALSGDIRMFDNHDGMGPLDYGVECGWCHGTTNLLDVHDGACTTCHSGPRSTFTTWNKTCQQGGCHVSFHTGASAGHQAEYYADDCETWCHDYDWGVPPQNCGGCHTLADTAAPTTSSNAAASYLGTARVTLTTSDPFPTGGVAHTYYKIDGGAQFEGTAIVVPGPTSGSAVHTIEFWSVDTAGNVETVHKTRTFTLNADTTAPVTTSNAKASYTGPAVVRFTATDNGSAGVKATYYTVDGGATQTGAVATVPQPSSGTQSHTLRFWSLDWSDNAETAHEVTFTNSVDSVPPVTTQTGLTTWIRSTRPLVTLNAVDVGDSGVVASYARVDGGTLYGGASTGSLRIYPYATTGMHTLTYWSIDAVGNTETAKSFSYGVDYTVPVTTVVTQNTYSGAAIINASATDNLSGVQNTYYRIDNGATQTGTSITVPAPASGSVYHYISVWSADNAGNTASPVYRYFYVNAPVGDTTAPTGTMSVNSGAAYATATAATVNSAMTDAGTGMSQMRVDPGTGVYGSWIAYSASYAITLPAGDGVKTVRAEYVDVAGNIAARSDTITLDVTGPAGGMSINNGAGSTGTTAVTINASMSDATSGMSQMRVDPGTGVYGSWIGYSASYAITLPGGLGTKTVNVEYRDNAGNVSTRMGTIELVSLASDTTSPTTTSDALATYTGNATITLTASDPGGSGVAHTYYRLDSGVQVEGGTISVTAPTTGSVAHSIEFWSIDVAGNIEIHKTADFTVYAPVATGIIQLAWNAESGSWADYWVYNSVGTLVASGSDDTSSGWSGWFNITVPVSPTPYSFYTEWYDSDWDEEGTTSGSALIDAPGKIVTIWY